jgi:hypothetical protein
VCAITYVISCISVCLCLSVSLCLCLSLSLSVSLSVSLSLSLSLSVSLSLCPSVSLCLICCPPLFCPVLQFLKKPIKESSDVWETLGLQALERCEMTMAYGLLHLVSEGVS